MRAAQQNREPLDGSPRREEQSISRPKIPFGRFALEFLAIFVAVSLSFLAEDWREHLGDRREEGRLLAGLVADLEADTAFATIVAVPITSRALESGLWLQAHWTRSDLGVDSLDWALDGLHRGIPHTTNRTAYEAAKNSGNLDLIENQELLRAINVHYEQTQPVVASIAELNRRFHFEFVEAIRPHVVFDDQFEAPLDLRLDPTNTSLGEDWPNPHFRKPWEEVRLDYDARASLAQTNTFRRLLLEWIRSHLAATFALRSAIQTELTGR